MHHFINFFFYFCTFPINIFKSILYDVDWLNQILFSLINVNVDFFQHFACLEVPLWDSDKRMHKELAWTVVTLDLTVDTKGSITLRTKELKSDSWMDGTVSSNFGFFRDFRPFMLMPEPIMMMAIVTAYTEVRILGLTILLRHIILTQLTNDLLLQLLILGLIDVKVNDIHG